ncbi:unnamed protein product, partial [Didymodactylos carnosus]
KVNTNSKSQRKIVRSASNHDGNSIHSAVYSSDFDDDEADDDTTTETDRVKKYGSLPPSKQSMKRVSGVLPQRRGSDSELKSKTIIIKSNQNHNRRKDRLLPYIRHTNKMNNNNHMTRTNHLKRKHDQQQQLSMPKGEVERRLLSAQNTKLKTLENKIAELKLDLDTIRVENHTLKTIQRREEMALKKYENQDYDIQRILKEYTSEIQHTKELLFNEKQSKLKLEKTIDSKDEILRDTKKRLKYYEKITMEKNLDERYEMKEKLKESDRKYQELLEKLTAQEKHLENLEKSHRYEVNSTLLKQKELKRELDKRQSDYNELTLKLEDKTRQLDTMHIYTQRGGHRPETNMTKSHSLQSLQQPDTSPRFREKILDYDKKRREQQEKKKAQHQQHQQQQQQEHQQQTKKPRTHDRLPPTSTAKKETIQYKVMSDDEKKIKKDPPLQN